MQTIEANIVDIPGRSIRPGRLTIDVGVVVSIDWLSSDSRFPHFLMPGFVDAHVHIESSMLTPAQFARIAVRHGTVATVSDPHEIANVLGIQGVQFMLDDAASVPFKFCFGAPSCVPATEFETSGSVLSVSDTESLLDRSDIHYLAEMMNFPGVLGSVPDVMAKIQAAKVRGKPVDGHAPGLRGDDARRYVGAGISTDHECASIDEAIEKIQAGAKIQIREGSAARNFEALVPLIDRYPGQIMLCSDDKHPDDLLVGHVNQLCRRALQHGCDLFHVLHAACLAPVQHYSMPVGQLRVGDPADFIEVKSLETFDVVRTFIDGVSVTDSATSAILPSTTESVNRFQCSPLSPSDLLIPSRPGRIRVIVAEDRQLTTQCEILDPKRESDQVVADVERDLLKLVVVNRYQSAAPAIALVRCFGMQRGAIAGSVGHDCHNIVAVGANDGDLCHAINEVIDCQGGLAVCDGTFVDRLPLPIAGLMSAEKGETVAADYQRLDRFAKQWGCSLEAPFMTLSFLPLLVIPSLKLSDQGLFDADRFQFVDLFVDP
ncbi:MAG: adenine deaminase [Planctomycetota bacterium]